MTQLYPSKLWVWAYRFGVVILAGTLWGCATGDKSQLPPASYGVEAPLYLIGPGDTVNVFVWNNPELSAAVPVGPDGRITTPLIEDVPATGRTSSQLARQMEKELQRYIRNPVVTVFVSGFVGEYSEQIRVIGEATSPQAIPFREHMTVLDVMIQVGGLTDFASGNRTVLIRTVDGQQQQYQVRLDDLVKDGDITANVDMLPGDVLIIPEAWF